MGVPKAQMVKEAPKAKRQSGQRRRRSREDARTLGPRRGLELGQNALKLGRQSGLELGREGAWKLGHRRGLELGKNTLRLGQ